MGLCAYSINAQHASEDLCIRKCLSGIRDLKGDLCLLEYYLHPLLTCTLSTNHTNMVPQWERDTQYDYGAVVEYEGVFTLVVPIPH